MSYCKELNILGIKTDLNDLQYKELRSAYLKKSLKYHPDKNGGDDQEFKLIVNAYEVLHEQLCLRKQARGDTETKTNYNSILEEIISEIKWDNLNKRWSSEFIGTTIQSIIKSVVGNSFKIFDNLDNNLSLEVYDFLVKFNMNSGIIDDSYMEKLKKILQKKKGYIIILQPSINDLLEDKIYKLEYKNKFYYVPLWHNELIFDNTNEDNENLIVKVIPELSNDIFIDDDNNIKYNIKLNTEKLVEIHNLGYLEIKLGKKQIIIPSYKINIAKNHQFFKYDNGIIKMNEVNIFDSSKRSSIIIELEVKMI
tara:strand:- start:1335 stop:2261 length:927 start_codon:yes stop_codon:yes gene_type:complete